jgi:ATP-dependent RNA helicase DeaD
MAPYVKDTRRTHVRAAREGLAPHGRGWRRAGDYPENMPPSPPAEHDSAPEFDQTSPVLTFAAPSFADLGLDDATLRAVHDAGYETPSAIQAATIPPLLAGRDVVGLAQTGTGKTAAFALPILSRLDRHQKNPQALVLAPTRELALQVCESFEKYGAHKGVHVLPVYGGQGYGTQLSALRRGVHVIVGTPGRIMDHLEKGTLDLSELKYLVLDEADEMLKMGFAEDVETILAKTPATKQVALFSATMPAPIRRLSAKYLHNPEEITIRETTGTVAQLTQRYLVVSYPQKVDALTRILEVENFEAMLIFTRTKNETETLAEKLRARGFGAAAINGDIVQTQRERTIKHLRDGKLDILVATDVAARGLDVERISHVVNFDIPIDTESYVHRVGRTGRAGRAGDAISFVTPRERRLLTAIERATRQPLTQMYLPSVDDVNATRLARFDDAITAALARPEEIQQFRDIVGHYIEHHDVPEADVAAALAVVAQGDQPLLLSADEERARAEFSRGPSGGAFGDGAFGGSGEFVQHVFDGRSGDARVGSRSDSRERAESRPRGDSAGRGDSASRGDSGIRSDRTRGERHSVSGPSATYRIAVGKRHKVEPRQIVGALANEGGLSRGDFGTIKINPGFSLVELPANLSPETLRKLSKTRISGVLIDLQPDGGDPSGRGASSRSAAPSRAGAPQTAAPRRNDGPPRKPRTN